MNTVKVDQSENVKTSSYQLLGYRYYQISPGRFKQVDIGAWDLQLFALLHDDVDGH